MKRTSLICAMLIALAFPALVVGQEATKSKASQATGVEQQLKQMEDNWTKANKNKDAATLKGIIAEDWIGTDEKGIVRNREEVISRVASNLDVIESKENFDLRVRVYGNTGVVVAGDIEKGMRKGIAYTDTSRWTDVFVKRAGTWQAVVSQWVRVH